MTASSSERGSVSTEFAVVMTAFLTSFMLLVVLLIAYVPALSTSMLPDAYK